MNALLVAINAKYIHSNLAVYSLRAFAKTYGGNTLEQTQIDIAEYTINHQQDDILQGLYKRRPDWIGISCYIWNIEYVKQLVAELAKILPECHIWLGGPEVSFVAEQFLQEHRAVKGIMQGEGEETFLELMQCYRVAMSKERLNDDTKAEWKTESKTKLEPELKVELKQELKSEADKELTMRLSEIKGITYRDTSGQIQNNGFRQPIDLSRVPFVYDDLSAFEHKIVYYESSRGCPFSCSYCLSSIDKKLRFRDMNLVKKELQYFLDAKVAQVKFVDRTFNCRHDHAMEIWRYLHEHDNGITNFHFEVSADLLTGEELALLKQMRPGLVQLEIGVQSTNDRTIQEIHRTMKFEQVADRVTQIQQWRNIHQHLDLIAGLPYEDYTSFANSFNEVYALKPEQLQLGFLKVLSGSYMYDNREQYGLVCKDTPPYEVLYTNWLTYDEVIRLKGIEEVVEIYYNSGQFTHTMNHLENYFETPFAMYESFSEYYEKHFDKNQKHARISRYEILLAFIRELAEAGELQLKQKYGKSVNMAEKSNFETVQYDESPEETQNGNTMDLFAQLLTLDLYLRENMKSRPAFAKDLTKQKEWIRDVFAEEARQPHYLTGYEGRNYRQLSNMVHMECFDYDVLGDKSPKKRSYLFDYEHRNPWNHEAMMIRVVE